MKLPKQAMPPLRQASSFGLFFNPSYRSLSRPTLPAAQSNSASKSKNSRSMSFTSGGGRRGGRFRLPKAGKGPAPLSQIKPWQSAQLLETLTAFMEWQKDHSPPAPTTAHVSNKQFALDSFFSLDRPLLELALPASQRRSLSPPSSQTIPPSMFHPMPGSSKWLGTGQDLPGGLEGQQSLLAVVSKIRAQLKNVLGDKMKGGLLQAFDGAVLVEVVDCGEDGTPTGPSYFASLSEAEAEQMDSPERLADIESIRAIFNEPENSLEIENEEPSDDTQFYDPWLINQPSSALEDGPFSGSAVRPSVANHAVSRYLASHSPFSPPPIPSEPIPKPATDPSGQPMKEKLAQYEADLQYLRPFSQPPERIVNNTVRHHRPMTDHHSRPNLDQLLDRALHAYSDTEHKKWNMTTGQKLDAALQKFEPRGAFSSIPLGNLFFGLQHGGRLQAMDENTAGSWQIGGPGGAFADLLNGTLKPYEGAAEFIENEEDFVENEESRRFRVRKVIQMDSIKRKRKTKMKKHKYKKRRKAQRALRIKLGKV